MLVRLCWLNPDVRASEEPAGPRHAAEPVPGIHHTTYRPAPPAYRRKLGRGWISQEGADLCLCLEDGSIILYRLLRSFWMEFALCN